MIEFISEIFEHFVDPRKRIFLGYILLSVAIAFFWLYKIKKLTLRECLSFIFDKKGKILHSWSKVKVKDHVEEVILFIKENKL